MNYCYRCYITFEDSKCPNCNTKRIRKVKQDDYCFLIEKDLLWAEMLKEILDNHSIPYTITSNYGAGLSIKMGIYSEKYSFYVPYKLLENAKSIINDIF